MFQTKTNQRWEVIRAEAETCFLENANYENTFINVTLDDSAPNGSKQPKHNELDKSRFKSQFC